MEGKHYSPARGRFENLLKGYTPRLNLIAPYVASDWSMGFPKTWNLTGKGYNLEVPCSLDGCTAAHATDGHHTVDRADDKARMHGKPSPDLCDCKTTEGSLNSIPVCC